MKLCFVTYQFKTGGVERVFCSIANNSENHTVQLLTVTPYYDQMIESIPSNVEFIDYHSHTYFKSLSWIRKRIPASSFFISVIYLLSSLIYIKTTKKLKESLIINFSDTISSLILSYYGRRINKSVSWLHYNPKTFQSSRFKRIYEYIYKKYDRIICICEEQKQLMLKIIPDLQPDRLEVIYNILDYPKMIELKDQSVDIDSDYIVMVARFDFRSKDFFSLINAYSKLAPQLKQKYKLVFVGDGPDKNQVIEYVSQTGLNHNIVFTGLQSNPYKWINHAKILVHSSKSEGLPTVLLESLACGTPVISTNCETGPSEILDYGRVGILVPVGNAEELTKAIEDLLNNNDLSEKYINKGYQQLSKFSLDSIKKKLNQLWIS